MNDKSLVEVASQIADGHLVDWPSVTPEPSSDEDHGVVGALEFLARIAVAHRELHQLLPAPEDDSTESTGDRARWGHLDLLDVVGRGSYGTVYRAWDTRLERLVALKLFHDARDPTVVMHEGRMLARVRHEHVVTVYGADVVNGVAGIWMEFVHGATLDQIMKRKGSVWRGAKAHSMARNQPRPTVMMVVPSVKIAVVTRVLRKAGSVKSRT